MHQRYLLILRKCFRFGCDGATYIPAWPRCARTGVVSAVRSCLQQRGGTVWRAHADACVREGLSAEHLQEEYRKRMLFYEEKDGPFAASGAELRRAASNYSWQATHSYQNGNSMPTYAKVPEALKPTNRPLSSSFGITLAGF